MSHRKHIRKQQPVFVAIAKKEKEFNMDSVKSAKFINKYPTRCLALLADGMTDKIHWQYDKHFINNYRGYLNDSPYFICINSRIKTFKTQK